MSSELIFSCMLSHLSYFYWIFLNLYTCNSTTEKLAVNLAVCVQNFHFFVIHFSSMINFCVLCVFYNHSQSKHELMFWQMLKYFNLYHISH